MMRRRGGESETWGLRMEVAVRGLFVAERTIVGDRWAEGNGTLGHSPASCSTHVSIPRNVRLMGMISARNT
jgi:hypothetical protein